MNPFHASSIIYWVETDLNGIITYANHGFLNKFSYLESNLVGTNILGTVVEKDRPKCVATVTWCFQNPGATTEIILRKPQENGKTFSSKWEFTLLVDAAGKPWKMQCIGFDVTEVEDTITEKNRVESTLQETIKNLEAVFDYMPLGIALTNGEGDFLNVNQSLLDITGYTEEELFQNNWYQLIRSSQKTIDFEHAFNHDRFGPIKFDIRGKHDQKIYVETFGSRFKDTNGQTRFWFIVQNATERVFLKRELEEKLQLLDDTGAVAKIGGWRIDLRTQQLSWTEQTYKIHETESATFIPTIENAAKFYHPNHRQKVVDLVTKALESGTAFNIVARFITQKGNEIWVRTIGSPIYRKGKIIAVGGTIQDITEQETARLQILKHNKTLKDIALIQSHVMRHPVSNLMGLTQLLDEHKLDQEETHKLLGFIKKETNKLDDIIKHIISISNEKA